MASSGITLLRSAREIKGVGSLDTVGKAVNAEILLRAEKTLLEEVEDAAKVQKYMQVDLQLNDTVTEWWTGTEAVDTDADVDDRLIDLFAFLQFSGGTAAIVVGHSLLFREILRRYMTLDCREVGRNAQTRRGDAAGGSPGPVMFPSACGGWLCALARGQEGTRSACHASR